MKNIILLTDFSESSRNAAGYVCNMFPNEGYKVIIQHIFITPVNAASEGMAVVGLRDAYETAEDRMDDMLADVARSYPGMHITGGITSGYTVDEAMRDVIEEQRPFMIVMGAINDYSDLWASGEDLLKLLTGMNVPVLLVPRHAEFSRLRHIGFACDYRNFCLPRQIDFIKWLVQYSGAQLHVVHVTRGQVPDMNIKQKNEVMLNEALAAAAPLYYTIENVDVVDSIARFIKDNLLDMLIVVPHRHDAWYNIFHRSYTKQLARLNHLPILALHD